MIKTRSLPKVLGAGGGKKPSNPFIAPNTLKTKTTARALFLTSDGEIGGLYDQANPLKSVLFNNVPVMNDDGTLNYQGVHVDERYGLPVQSFVPGYPSASSTYNVNQTVTVAAPVPYSVTTSDVDAVRITIRFPALVSTDSAGNEWGATVIFRLQRRLGVGAWTTVHEIEKGDKNLAPADADFVVQRPTGAGTWQVRVVRVSADSGSATLSNTIIFHTATELRYVNLAFNGRAYIGVTVTSAATGTSYPTISFDLRGVKLKMPSNYNPVTRAYSGSWNGSWSATTYPSDNGAWALYFLLTDPESGMGIPEADIDKFSFYDAAYYNDQLVPTADGGGTEPRFTFNQQLMTQGDAWSVLQEVAGSFGAQLIPQGSRIKLVQDRPTAVSRTVSNSSVIGGRFDYKSSADTARYTACRVMWNNPAENGLMVPAYYEQPGATTITVQEVTGVGITSEGQALRLARWHVETSLRCLTSVTFQVGFSNADFMPGEVFKVADSVFAQKMIEARVVSLTATTMTLDKPVPLVNGDTFDVPGSDGMSLVTRTVTSTGTLTTFNFSGGAASVSPGAVVIFTGSVAPRLFKAIGLREDEHGKYTVTGLQYATEKFALVDDTPVGDVSVYQEPTFIPSEPQNLVFRESGSTYNNVVRHGLTISWERPEVGTVSGYFLRWRVNASSWNEVEVDASSYVLENVLPGTYEAQVFARGMEIIGPPATGTYTINVSGGSLSTLNAPTTLQINGGGTAFSTQDINFRWTNPSSNSTVVSTLRDFEVRFIETTGSTVVRTVYVPGVPAGAVQTFSYTYAMNTEDGGPRRSMQVQVRCRDTSNNLSNPVTQTFTNASPAVPSAISVVGGIQSTKVSFTAPTDPDLAGFLIWGSTTNGFTPAAGNLLYDGKDNYVSFAALSDLTAYYYRIAAYDTFGKSTSGTGLNLSAQQSATTTSIPGVPSGTVVPGTGTTGAVFFNTTDGQLYRWNGTAWAPIAVPAASVTGQLTNSQLADLAAAKITGTIGATQIASDAITTPKLAAGAITTAKIATDAVTANEIAANAITASELAANAVTAGKIAANAVTANEIAANAVTAGKIAAAQISAGHIVGGTITGDKLVANTITGDKIAANTVTANKINGYGLEVLSGAYTGWAWPSSGGTGFYLGANGLLFGNYNDNRYLVLNANGDIVAPNFSITNGVLNINGGGTFSGNLSAAGGTFSGNLSAAGGSFTGALSGASGTFSGSLTAQTVTADNIVGGALSTSYGASTSANSVSVSITIPTASRSISIFAFYGNGTKGVPYYIDTGKSGSYSTYYVQSPAAGTLSASSVFGSTSSFAANGYTFSDPTAGSYTFTATRSGSEDGTYYGALSIVAILTRR
jgi:predicted phage tail protein